MKYFEHMLRKDERCMYRLDHADWFYNIIGISIHFIV